MSTRTLWLAVELLCLSVLVLCLACDDSPTSSNGEPIDYPFYFIDNANGPELFVLHPSTGQLDSITIPWTAERGITVSADGQRLYICHLNGIAVLSTGDNSLIAQVPYVVSGEPGIGVSPDNRLVAIASNGLHVLNTSDYGVVFEGAMRITTCRFSSGSERVYCAQSNSDTVLVVDLSLPGYPVTPIATGGGLLRGVIPTPDESKLLVYKKVSGGSVFQVIDLSSNAIIFEDFVGGCGNVTMSPEGDPAFYSSPRCSLLDPAGLLGFKIFDIQANEIDTVFRDTAFYSSDPNMGWFAEPKMLAVTPDGRWLGMIGGSWLQFIVYLYDIQRESLVWRKVPLIGAGVPQYSNVSAQEVK